MPPAQIAFVEVLMPAVGLVLTITVVMAVAVQVPSPAVTVMLYVPELLVVLHEVGLPVLLMKLPLLAAQL